MFYAERALIYVAIAFICWSQTSFGYILGFAPAGGIFMGPAVALFLVGKYEE